MKNAFCIAICLLALLLLFGCRAKKRTDEEPTNTEPADKQSVTFVNSVEDADVWILPETEANLKTTLWGTATVSGAKAGESCRAPLCEPGDNGHYLFRMIDTDHFYYSADGITLEDGWTLEIKGDDLHSVVLEVADRDGVLTGAYHVLAAKL